MPDPTPAFVLVTRAVRERGKAQLKAMRELDDRGLWLSETQCREAGLAPGKKVPDYLDEACSGFVVIMDPDTDGEREFGVTYATRGEARSVAYNYQCDWPDHVYGVRRVWEDEEKAT